MLDHPAGVGVLAPTAAWAGEDPLVTKAETCLLLHSSYPTLWKMVREGKLAPGRYVGSRVFWLRSEIEAFRESLPRQGTNDAPAGRTFPGTTACKASGRSGRPRKVVEPVVVVAA
jgi:predicted DNA-binding transcriptional regulator AlpA